MRDAGTANAPVSADAFPVSAGTVQPIDDFGKLDGVLSGYAWVALY
jgi:hypothetical protein